MLADLWEFLYILLFMAGLCGAGMGTYRNYSKQTWRYVLAVFLTLVTSYITSFINRELVTFIFFPEIFIYCLLFEGKILQRIGRFLRMYFWLRAIELAIYMIFTTVCVLDCPREFILFIVYIFIDAMLFVAVRSKWYQKFIGYLGSLSWRQYAAIIVIILSGALLIVISKEMEYYITDAFVLRVFRIAIWIELTAVVTGIIWFVQGIYKSDYYYKQNRLKEEIIEVQQKYYQIMYEKDKEIRGFRHDIAAQLNCVKMLLEQQDTNAAQEHLQLIEKEFAKTQATKYHVGNELLDVIINHMYVRALEKGVDIEVSGTISDALDINFYDLCTIFSNALSNAVEACEKMEGCERKVEVCLEEHRKSLFCRFANPATHAMYTAVKSQKTSKKDAQNHGLGIGNIQRAVERNQGSMEYLYQNGMLVLEIFL